MTSKKSIYNLIVGIVSQALILLTAILVPRLIMVNIGSEANGLLNSVNQALVYLGLMEAGVGTVTIQALYGPLSKNDKQEVCGVLSATKKYYYRTGTWYMIAVILFSFVYPILVQTELPKRTVALVIFFSGGAGAISYFFHGKYNLLLSAEGKQYILSGVSTAVHVIVNLLRVVLLLCGFDVVVLQAAYFAVTAMQSICICAYIRHKYKWLNLNVSPNEKAISQKNSVLMHQICGLIFNNTDVLLLTLTWGLKYVSVYSVFTLVFGQLGSIVTILTSSLMFVLGQSYQTDLRKFSKYYDYFELTSFVLTFTLGSVCAIMITPFIKIYTLGVTDINYLNNWYSVLFLVVFILTNLRAPAQTAITVAGHFKSTTRQAFIEAGINLIISCILLSRFGIVGVLIGTVVALLYRTNDMIIYSAKYVHKHNLKRTYGRILRNGIIFLSFFVISQYVSLPCDTFFAFVKYGGMVGIGTVAIFVLINTIVEFDVVKGIIKTVRK